MHGPKTAGAWSPGRAHTEIEKQSVGVCSCSSTSIAVTLNGLCLANSTSPTPIRSYICAAGRKCMSMLAANGAPSVSGLLTRVCPAAIPRFIVAVVVRKTVQTLLCGTLAHVSKKGDETIHPRIADGDASTSITRESWVLPVEASFFHILPNPIFRSGGLLPRLTVIFALAHVPNNVFPGSCSERCTAGIFPSVNSRPASFRNPTIVG
jgi:hypothetical protein